MPTATLDTLLAAKCIGVAVAVLAPLRERLDGSLFIVVFFVFSVDIKVRQIIARKGIFSDVASFFPLGYAQVYILCHTLSWIDSVVTCIPA